MFFLITIRFYIDSCGKNKPFRWGKKARFGSPLLQTLCPWWISPHAVRGSCCSFAKNWRLISAEHSRLPVHHGWNDVHQTIQSKEVTVLSVALHPQRPVGQLVPVRQRSRFTEIDHPDFGPTRAVVDKQQGAANHLGRQSRREKQESMKTNKTLRVCFKPWVQFLFCSTNLLLSKHKHALRACNSQSLMN